MTTDDNVATDVSPSALENAARLLSLKHHWGQAFGSHEKGADGEIDTLPKYRAAMRNPRAVYNHPRDIVADESLYKTQKLNILIYWAAEASQQQRPEVNEKNHGDPTLLADITSSLKEIVDIEHRTP